MSEYGINTSETSNKSLDYNIFPLLFIIVGICEGTYAVKHYLDSVKKIQNGTFVYSDKIGYFYAILCVLLILTASGFAIFLFKKVL